MEILFIYPLHDLYVHIVKDNFLHIYLNVGKGVIFQTLVSIVKEDGDVSFRKINRTFLATPVEFDISTIYTSQKFEN
jgi:hypothetical protein